MFFQLIISYILVPYIIFYSHIFLLYDGCIFLSHLSMLIILLCLFCEIYFILLKHFVSFYFHLVLLLVKKSVILSYYPAGPT